MSMSPDIIACSQCPHGCRLGVGGVGLCRARVRNGDAVVSVFGDRTTSLVVDPIEKKPLYHFLPGSRVLSLGTFGCNFDCDFCQNAHITREASPQVLTRTTTPTDLVNEARQQNCSSVAFTYNEPIVWGERVAELAAECRAAGLKTVVVTNGFIDGESRQKFFANIDAANVDLKSFSDKFYVERCGGRLTAVQDTLRYLVRETNVWLEVTTLLIPGLNDSDEEISSLATWYRRELGAEVPLHFSAFRPAHRMRSNAATPPQTLYRARQIGIDAGLVYVYTGNIADAVGSTTLCPQCRQAVVERDGFRLLSVHIDADGCCMFCGTTIAGVFDAD
ncbi:MAG: AmmeMemoRadiSam system radical SAM enzyme [Thermoguttaceae bacterium]